MPQQLLKFVLLPTLIFAATILAVRALGSAQPPNPALRGFTEGCEGKSQPCWYGIVLGVTDVKLARNLLFKYQYPAECVYFGSNKYIVTNLELWPCAILPPLYFGNIVSHFGRIKGLSSVPNNTDIIVGDDLVIFENRYVSAEINSIYWLKDKFMTIVPIIIATEPIHKVDSKWYGNIPKWKMCQIEPNYYVCGFCRLISDIAVYDTSGVCK